MDILLCSGSHAVLRRWTSALEDGCTLYQATSPADLDILTSRITFDILLLHRALIDVATTSRLRTRQPACRLFVLSDRPDDEEGLRFLRSGAVGYANTFITPARLRQAVRLLANGSVWVGQRLMQRLIREIAPDGPVPAGGRSPAHHPVLRSLSNREYQVAGLVAEGLSNQEIGHRLGITERTVKAHLGSIYAKTDVRGRLNLALLLRE